MTLTLTRAEQREAAATAKFFERVMEGCGPLNAAIEVGWTPTTLKRRMKDDDFNEALQFAQERRIESVEEVIWGKALEGVRWAAQMVAYNQRSDTWKDVRHINVNRPVGIDPSVVVSVKQAVLEMMSAPDSIASLQPAPKIIEAVAVDVDDNA